MTVGIIASDVTHSDGRWWLAGRVGLIRASEISTIVCTERLQTMETQLAY